MCTIRTRRLANFSFFFFNDTATTEIYTLSLHDALPISQVKSGVFSLQLLNQCRWNIPCCGPTGCSLGRLGCRDRKSTRLNSSHGYISYAVFCLKKKKKTHLVHYAAVNATDRPLLRPMIG